MPKQSAPIVKCCSLSLASWNSPFSYASHILPKTQQEAQEMKCRYLIRSTQQETLSGFLGPADLRFPEFPSLVCEAALGSDVRLVWELVSFHCAGELGWPQPGSGGRPGLSDVMTSFLGCHYNWPCAAPRISHTLTAPFTNLPSHSSLCAISHRYSTGLTHAYRRPDIYTQATVTVCFVSLTASEHQ